MDFENKCSISVMPIFYVVDPCHLRRQSGDVVEHFNKDGSDHSKRDLSLLSVVAMACAEQPIKKRRLYESIPESQPPPPPQPESQSPSTVVSSFLAPVTPSPPSQEEIQTRSRNREEIRRVHDCYKRLKSCIGQRDGGGRSANLEQAYRSLISASKGIYTSAPSCVCEYGYFSGFGYSNCYCNQIGALTLMNVRKEKDETAVENKLV